MYDKYPLNFKYLSLPIESAIGQCKDMKESISCIVTNGDPSENYTTTDYDMMQQIQNSLELIQNMLEASKLHISQTSDLLQTL